MNLNREINKIYRRRKSKSILIYHNFIILLMNINIENLELSDHQLILLLKSTNCILSNNNKKFDHFYKKISKKSNYDKIKDLEKYAKIYKNIQTETGIITDFLLSIDKDIIINNYMIYEVFVECKYKVQYSANILLLKYINKL